MGERQKVLKFLEKIKALQEETGDSFETCVRAIAMQAVIFERIEPVLWDVAIADAQQGFELAMPERTN